MRRIFLALTPGLILLTSLVRSATGPEFEAVSVKPNVSGERRQSQRTDGRTFRATNVPARSLLRQAYGLMFEDYRLAGAPDWIAVERFDVVATLPEQAPHNQVPAMLRAMLADRFRLVTHTETREAPAYALVLARKDGRLGPQLHHDTRDCGAPGPAPASQDDEHPCELQIGGEIRGRGQPMDQLAKTLLQFAGRSIVNRTGLAGGFDFDIQASEIAGVDDLPSIYTAIQEQLGLKLESIRAPVEFVVVDRIDHPESN
jgi:uncharacterized protein (TIGR03435 family)